jgi:hypothetical protein
LLATLAASLAFAAPVEASPWPTDALVVVPHYAVMVDTRGDEPTNAHGGGVAVRGELGLDIDFALAFEGSYSALAGSLGVVHLAGAGVGVRFTIDAGDWMPWVDLLGRAWVRADPKGAEPDGGASLGFGVDYMGWDGVGLGIGAHYHLMATRIQIFPATLTIGGRVLLF